MADIFISYASDDLQRVEPIAKALEGQGWTIFLDRTIPVRKSWRGVIQSELEAAKCVVVIWTENSINYRWVLAEVNEAYDKDVLTQVLFDNVTIPFPYKQEQAADLTDWRAKARHAGFERFLSAISDIVGFPPPQKKSEQIGEIPESSLEQQLEILPDEGVTPQPTPRTAELTKVKSPEPRPDATVTTEPKPPEFPKTSNALKIGAVTGVIVLLLIFGTWWWISDSQKKKLRLEAKSKIERISEEIALLEQNVLKIESFEQLDDLNVQRDSLSQQAGAISDQAVKAGLVPKLEETQNRLIQVKIQLTNKVIKNKFDMEFVTISAGSFKMGTGKEGLRYSDVIELPSPDDVKITEKTLEDELQHKVTISRSFYIQTTEVTQGHWKKIMGNNPSYFRNCGDDCPVEKVSWMDTQEFIKKLNEMEGTNKYRLPSEAEWEYAGRAGTETLFYFGDDGDKLTDYAWFRSNSNSKSHRVGTKKPNPWGLYDMHGNVWEWVEDDWHHNYKGAPEDGSAWIDEPRGAYRVTRGGSWYDDSERCRSAHRFTGQRRFSIDSLGFRLARSVALVP